MSFRLSLLVMLLACGCAGRAVAQRIPVIPAEDRLVVDRAGVLSATEVRLLEQKLIAYDDSSSTQIVVVIVPDLGGVPAADYAVELGRVWGVGQQGKDNGAVILVSRDDREVFIATGYGLEGAITDAVASQIVRNILVPSFRQGQFYEGLNQATDAVMLAAQGEFTADAQRPVARRRGIDPLFILLLILVIIIFATNDTRGGGRGGGRRYRGGPFILWGGGLGGGGGGGGGFGGGLGGGGFGGFGGGGFGGGGAGGGW